MYYYVDNLSKGIYMTIKAAQMGIYSLFLTNYYGFKLKSAKTSAEKGPIRNKYSQILLDKLKIKVIVDNPEKIPTEGQYLIAINHRSVIDPLIILLTFQDTEIYGDWVAKKELYDSPFFGLFVRNAGTVLVDREKTQMSGFFGELKKSVKSGNSICIFPEGSRNKTDESLLEFKGGANLMAMKNKIDILPIYIKENTATVLNNSLKPVKDIQNIHVEIGDLISFKDRNLEENYKKQFNL